MTDFGRYKNNLIRDNWYFDPYKPYTCWPIPQTAWGHELREAVQVKAAQLRRYERMKSYIEAQLEVWYPEKQRWDAVEVMGESNMLLVVKKN